MLKFPEHPERWWQKRLVDEAWIGRETQLVLPREEKKSSAEPPSVG